MTPEVAASLVLRWVRFYTLGLPPAIRARRVEELAADLHDHIAYERARGTGDRRIALALLSRMLRGLGADASWRSAADRFLTGLVLGTLLLLSMPLVAMQLSGDVAWGLFDFAFAGSLLIGTGLLARTALRRSRGPAYRAAAASALATAFLLVWVNAAVGVVGSEDEAINLAYAGVLAVGVLGTLAARMRPAGMARALAATALAVVVAAAVALATGAHENPGSSVPEILALNGVFAALFLGSALLFRRAARREPLRS